MHPNSTSFSGSIQTSSKHETDKKQILLQNVKTIQQKTSSLMEAKPNASLTIKKVTDDLVDVIKNLQRQLQQIPKDKKKKEELPPDFMEPKNTSFFKKPPQSANKGGSGGSKTNSAKSNNTNSTKNSTNSSNNSAKSLKGAQLSNKISRESNASRKSYGRANSNSVLSAQSSTSNRRFLKRISTPTADPLKIMRDDVFKAMRERKTFTVVGHFYSVRRALLARGWIEKLHASYKEHLSAELRKYQNYSIHELMNLLKNQELTRLCRTLIKSKLLGTHQVDFYWGSNDESFKNNPDKIKYTLINKLKRDIFSYTSKQGLCDATKVAHWYNIPGVSKMNHPRSYSLVKSGDMSCFIDDFRVTAAMSVLKWIVNTSITKETKIISTSGKIPLEVFEFAINECRKFVKRQKHEDIDKAIPKASDHEWDQFLTYVYKTIHYNNHFKKETNSKEDEASLVKKSTYMLDHLRANWFHFDMDGFMNMWILKPTGGSRGRGIHICRTLNYITQTVKQNPAVRYIVQKYIERPLLIYNTKFDIRQWFLISNSSPLTIWMYKDCYLRFSSQTYNLRKLHEAIHLTNNSVQSKYKNTILTDSALPNYNMWDLAQFKDYLSNIGYPDVFARTIFPGMKQCITASVLVNQDKMVYRKNSFELYGADFILTENFEPWLLEINSNPALFASTPVTARLCPKVLEDVIKVIVDYSHNNRASTGDFQLIYRERMLKLPNPPKLELFGHSLRKDYFYTPKQEKINQSNHSSHSAESMKKSYLKNFEEDVKKTLHNLLEVIQNERNKRVIMKHKNIGCNSFNLINGTKITEVENKS